MSQKTGARGCIIIPKKEFSNLSKSLITNSTEMKKKDYEIFNKFIEQTILKYKGKRNLDWINIMNDDAHNFFLQNPKGHNRKSPFKYFRTHELAYQCINFKDKTEKPKLLKQKKIVKTNIIDFIFDENCISIDKDKSTINIFVSYNNHSLEEAQKNPFFQLVIKTLNGINWTKNTGGEVYAKKEQDDDYYGECSPSYLLYQFGKSKV